MFDYKTIDSKYDKLSLEQKYYVMSVFFDLISSYGYNTIDRIDLLKEVSKLKEQLDKEKTLKKVK